jgi:hypothetical protein
MSRALLTCCLIPASAALALAQPRPSPPRQLLLSPNRPPMPVLRLTLLPELRDQEPGDAWPLYQKAGEQVVKVLRDGAERAGAFDLVRRWASVSYADLPRDEVRQLVALFREPLALLEKASRCENCNCDVADRIRRDGASRDLREAQHMRFAIMFLCLKARLELADDQPEQALRTLQAAYCMGQRFGESSNLISLLVGIVVTTITNNTLLEALNHPKMPNLYWALTNRPQSSLSLHRAMGGERMEAYANFPGLLEVSGDLDAGPLPEEQLRKAFKAGLKLVNMPDNFGVRLFVAGKIHSQDAEARKALIAAGRPREKVESWPPLQVALLYGLMEFDQQLDEMKKWDNFPYYQIRAELDEMEHKFRTLRARPLEMRSLPLAAFVLPKVNLVVLRRARLERQFAELRCIEAIRLYAAGHDGQLPASLTDIKEVPLPVCPVTGKPFEYRLEGESAFLSAPETPGEFWPAIWPRTIQIKIRR